MTNKEKARIAFSNRLFVNGWELRTDLLNIINGHYEFEVELHYEGKKPVGVIVFGSYEIVGIFVRKKYRRMGIGTKLVEAAKKKMKRVEQAHWGIYGSEYFFESINIQVKKWC